MPEGQCSNFLSKSQHCSGWRDTTLIKNIYLFFWVAQLVWNGGTWVLKCWFGRRWNDGWRMTKWRMVDGQWWNGNTAVALTKAYGRLNGWCFGRLPQITYNNSCLHLWYVPVVLVHGLSCYAYYRQYIQLVFIPGSYNCTTPVSARRVHCKIHSAHP